MAVTCRAHCGGQSTHRPLLKDRRDFAESCYTARSLGNPLMGVIRFLLALAVVYGHAAGASIIAPYTPTFGYFPIDPVTAVQMFFVISGFYMSLVLTEKYRALDGWLWKFYLNRYSRLMPSYLIVMAVSTLLVNPQIF